MNAGTQAGHRLTQQLEFILVCDQLKRVQRTTYLHDGSRAENSAEHSWHLAVMALTLGEYAPVGTDLEHVLRLLLVHDLVEIKAGDLHFDAAPEALARKASDEAAAARQLFGLLPPQQSATFMALWEEFEAQETPEARFAKALDALQPMLLTWGASGAGCTNRYPELTQARVLRLKERHLAGFPALWEAAQATLQAAVSAGTMPRG